MGFTEVGEHTNVWADAVGESCHFTRVADAGFDDPPSMVRRHFREGQRHADLAVVTARATKRHGAWGDELQQPFFDRGFAVASGDGDDGCSAGVAPLPGKRLPGGYGIGTPDDVGFRQVGQVRGVADEEVPRTFGMGFLEECVSVMPIACESDKRSGSGFGGLQRPRILSDEQGGIVRNGSTGRGYGVYS